MKGIQGFKASEWGLKPLDLDTWGPFIFLWMGAGGSGAAGSGDGAGSSSGGGSGSLVAGVPPLEEWLGEPGDAALVRGLVFVCWRGYCCKISARAACCRCFFVEASMPPC